MILLNLLIIDIACTFAVIWFVLFMLLLYLYGEGLASCKILFPIQLYIYIENKMPYNILNTNICYGIFHISLLKHYYNGIFHISFFKALLINEGKTTRGKRE
jgi:hypothetical protein